MAVPCNITPLRVTPFESDVESKTENPTDHLYFLELYTRGHPREILKSCRHMPADHGYLRAKALKQAFQAKM